MRGPAIDRNLVMVSLALMLFGLATLYSAGQTDVPTRAAGVWQRQFVWFGVGIVACWVVYNVSLRVLEWVAPALYAFSILLLGVVLVVGTGAGTAESSHSWLSIGGHQIGQPSELAKVATVLMLARFLSSRKEAPRSLRDLIGPALIVGVPFLMVLKQPDLGSALVFVGIFFAMLFWSGVRPRLLFLMATPGISLLLAFNTLAWSAWIIIFVLILIAWRPYVWDWTMFLAANVAMGAIAMPLWTRLAPVPAEPAAHLSQSRGRSPRGRLPCHPVPGRDRIRRLVRHRLHRGSAEATGLPAGAAHRLRLLGGGGRARLSWRGRWRWHSS